LIKDKSFIELCLSKYGVTKTIYDYCCKDVEMINLSYSEIIKQKEKDIEEINIQLDKYKEKKKLTKVEKHNKKRCLKNKAKLLRSLNKGVCFGGKETLRQITKLSQIENRTPEQDKSLEDKKLQFTENRKRSIFLWGKALEGGNRCVDFKLKENKVLIKFDKNNHVELDLVKLNSKKRINNIDKIDNLISQNLIPITVRVCDDHVCLTFDNEDVNGYSFNTTAYNQDVKTHPHKDKKEIKNEHKAIQREKKLKGKIVERVAAVDMNPAEIGFSIVDIDKNTGEIERVVFHRAYYLGYYVFKKKITAYDTNKHNCEIVKCYDEIFSFCKHFKVSSFAIEDLTKITTKDNYKKTYSKYFNRITKNRWKRNLQENIIKSRCDEQGILFNMVKPHYSSFIGNIQQNLYDCCASATEIARRGYTNDILTQNYLFPSIRTEDYQKVSYLVGHDVSDIKTWKGLYNILKTKNSKTFGGVWRNKKSTKGNYLNNKKSNVIIRL